MTEPTFESIVEQIEHDGYCKLAQIFSAEQIKKSLDLVLQCRNQIDEIPEDKIPQLSKNQRIVFNLQNKDYFFIKMLLSPDIVQRILMYFLNDSWVKSIPSSDPNYILRTYFARSSNIALPLHIDSLVPYVSDYPFAMQVSIILEDQNETNGCTLMVPGSHQSGAYAPQDALRHAVPLPSQAGDVVIWDSRLWHGALPNHTAHTRWALIATFSRWWLKQAFNIPQRLPQYIYERLTPQQKAILGFCSIPYNDEFEGIDMKRGYDNLKEKVSDYHFSA